MIKIIDVYWMKQLTVFNANGITEAFRTLLESKYKGYSITVILRNYKG